MSTNLICPSSRKNNVSNRRGTSAAKKSAPSDNGGGSTFGNGNTSKSSSPIESPERTMKNLKLSKALTIPEGTTVSEACRRMATRRVHTILLTDSNGLLSGIVTDKDISTRVIAEGLRLEQTPISKIMTRNPVFIMADTLAIEALHKMVQGKFRYLPVVDNGEVIAMLDITKCLYDAISRMEKAAEQSRDIAAVVEGVEGQWGILVVYAWIDKDVGYCQGDCQLFFSLQRITPFQWVFGNRKGWFERQSKCLPFTKLVGFPRIHVIWKLICCFEWS